MKKILLLVFTIFAAGLYAQDKPVNERKVSTEDKISILEEEIEKLKLKKATKTYTSIYGMGPAASAVYETADGLSIGGYAEIVATDNKSRYLNGVADTERLVLYTGYHFSDKIIFNSEIEIEHAGFEREKVVTDVDFTGRKTEKSGINSAETFVEFAYLDFILNKSFQVRAGLNLVPIGITNYMHEPTTFYSVYRTATETSIIPSTWREMGIFAQGELASGRVVIKTGVMSGLDGRNFSEDKWIKDGRYKGSNADLRDLAYILNVDTKPAKNLTIGGTYYLGGAGQGNIDQVGDQNRVILPANTFTGQAAVDMAALRESNTPKAKIQVHLAEAHFQYKTGMFDFRGLFVRGWMNEDDSRALNRATGENIGQVAEGGYLEAAMNVLAFTKSSKKMMLFIRDERLNTQRRTIQRHAGGREDLADAACSGSTVCKTTGMLPDGDQDLGIIANSDPGREMYGVKGVGNQTNDRSILTFGMAFFPHPNVVLKLEYARHHAKSDYYRDNELLNPHNNRADKINFGAGVIF